MQFQNEVAAVFDSLKLVISGQSHSTAQLRENFGKVCLNFANTGQQDASEFLTRLLVLGDSHLTDLFEVVVSKTKRCLECNETGIMTTDEAVIFRVSSTTSDLQSLIDARFQEELFLEDGLDFNNTRKIFCAKCKRKMPSSVQESVIKSSKILVIQALRYNIGDGNALRANILPNTELKFGDSTYTLKSIAIHHGHSLDSGHYTCSFRQGKKWFKVNDSLISPTTVPKRGFLYFYELNEASGSNHVILNAIYPRPTTREEVSVPMGIMHSTVGFSNRQTRKRTRTEKIPDESVPAKRVSNRLKGKSVIVEAQNVPNQEPNLGKSNEESNIDTGSSDGDYIEFDEILKRKQMLKAGIKIQRDLSKIKLSEPCRICQNRWFDLRIGPRSGLCDRCATEKKNTKEVQFPTYSKENDMHPAETPIELSCLNPVELNAIKLNVPMMYFYKRQSGTHGSRGNCVAFQQDVSGFANSLKKLPRAPKDLPIVVLQAPGKDNKGVTFKANRYNILKALQKLKEICPPYKDIEIDFDALSQYPENESSFIDGVRTLPIEEKDKNKPIDKLVEEITQGDFNNIDEIFGEDAQDMVDAIVDNGGLPQPQSTYMTFRPEVVVEDKIKDRIANIEVTNNRKEGQTVIENQDILEENDNLPVPDPVGDASSNAPKVNFPTRGTEAVSEYEPYYFTKAFPHLFPDGKGDITVPRKGKTPKISDWAKHLLRFDRKFAKDPNFSLIVCNQLQRHQAISTGNMYAKGCLKDITVKELKDKIKEGDKDTMNGILSFGTSIKGSAQYFRKEKQKAFNFIRHAQIMSDGKDYVNTFLTFSPADMHWRQLHEMFPKDQTEPYLDKIVVKSLKDIPEGADPKDYITTAQDYMYRNKVISQNADICNFFFRKKVDLMIKYVLEKVIGLKDYKIRYEFQNRGSIHAHMLVCISHGPTAKDLQEAMKVELRDKTVEDKSESDDYVSDTKITDVDGKKIGKIRKRIYTEATLRAREKIIRFAVERLNISARHPTQDPKLWPGPEGQSVYKPKHCVLREKFRVLKKNPLDYCRRQYEKIVNYCMLHSCKVGYCKKGEGVLNPCKHHFPYFYHGYTPKYKQVNEKEHILDEVVKSVGTPSNLQETVNGRRAPILGASFVVRNKTELRFVRNHQRIVKHIPELLLLWQANCEASIVQGHKQLMEYLMKYTLKAEKSSATIDAIKKQVYEKVSDDEPVRKLCQKLLMKTVTERDISVNEAMLLLNGENYVECSRQYRYCSLEGNNLITDQVESEKEKAVKTYNWSQAYWDRETNANYTKLIQDYEEGKFEYKRHPRDLSLRYFMSDFRINWEYEGSGFVPCPNPIFMYTVPKDSARYENYCKSTLLFEKPGCYLSNVGEGFDSFHDELKDFVENSEFCSDVIKEEFKDTQKSAKEKRKNKENRLDMQQEINRLNNDCDSDDDTDCSREYLGDFDEMKDDEFARIFLDEDCEDLHVAEQVVQGEPDLDAPLDDNQIICNLGRRKKHKENVIGENEEVSEGEASDYDSKEFVQAAIPLHWNDIDVVKEISPGFNLREAVYWIDHQKGSADLPDLEDSEIDVNRYNAKQRAGFDLVTAWMRRKIEDPNTEQFLLNVCGSAGVGKTYWLRGLLQEARILKVPNFIRTAAPTASAAFLINGNTLHSTLRIPVPIVRGKPVPELNEDILRDLQFDFTGCHILVIDEKSMMGLELFHYVDERLRQIKAKDEPFGGMSLIIMGDFAQLPPVCDKPLYTESKLDTNQGKAALMYKLFKNVIIFDQIMRQQGDEEKEFRDVLSRLVQGRFVEKDWDWLCSQNLKGMSKERQKYFEENAVKICSHNKDLKRHNIIKMKSLGQPIAPIKAVHNCNEAKSADPSDAGGLPKNIIACQGAKMRITRNLWREAGLTNGAECFVRYIVYNDGNKPPSLPNVVLVHVPQYRGPSFFPDEDRIVPIPPVTHRWYSRHKVECTRSMIPLIPGYAVTIHKAQGTSLSNVIIDLGTKEFCTGMTYTALSRCRKISNLALDPFPDFLRFRQLQLSKAFIERLEEDKKARRLEKATLKKGRL